jgi:hypothetical protein
MLFSILFLGFLFVMIFSRNRKRVIVYACSGSILGFYFDYVSYTDGYYSYPSFYKITILGLPFTMTIAEGFAIVITIYLYYVARKVVKEKRVRAKYLLFPDECDKS